eukprot:2441162-Amphidinium_carterae.1
MSCLRLRVGSTRLQPPGLTQQMVGPGVLASPTRQVGGNQPSCRVHSKTLPKESLGSQGVHR